MGRGNLLGPSTGCPRCGAPVDLGSAWCPDCGTSFAAPEVGGAASRPARFRQTTWEYEREVQVGRTKTGVLFLLAGILVSWVPGVGPLGYALVIAGAVFVIRGRKAFGSAHGRHAIASLALTIAAIGLYVLDAVLVARESAAALAGGPAADPAALVVGFQTSLLLGIPVAILLGLAFLLFTLSLQRDLGRTLLFAAYGSNVALAVAIDLIISPALAAIVANALASGATGPGAVSAASAAFAAEVRPLALLGAIPTALFAIALYLAWGRLKRGEVPPPVGPPGTTSAATIPPS